MSRELLVDLCFIYSALYSWYLSNFLTCIPVLIEYFIKFCSEPCFHPWNFKLNSPKMNFGLHMKWLADISRCGYITVSVVQFMKVYKYDRTFFQVQIWSFIQIGIPNSPTWTKFKFIKQVFSIQVMVLLGCGSPCCLHLQGEDEGSMDFQNIGILHHYMVSQSRRQLESSSPWRHQFSQLFFAVLLSLLNNFRFV
jgi:hypothetical protein